MVDALQLISVTFSIGSFQRHTHLVVRNADFIQSSIQLTDSLKSSSETTIISYFLILYSECLYLQSNI